MIVIMSLEKHISELRGYLQSLQRLCKKRCDFDATIIPMETDLNETVTKYVAGFNGDFECIAQQKINFEEIEDLLQNYIYSNLSITNIDQIKLIDWDIIEFYGKASLEPGSTSDVNPLVTNGAIQVSITSKHYQSCAHFVVELGGHAVVTSLAVCS